jgi:DNA-binding transcriptional LysR family regulator
MTTAMHRLTEDLDQFANGLRGTIRLLANTNALSEFLPAPVSHFLASHPNVNIQLEEKLSHEIVDALMEGTADMGILAASADIGMLQSYPFASDRLCAVVPAAQKDFSGLTSIDFLSLLRHPFVSNASGAAIQMYLEAQAQNLHGRIHSRIHLGSFEAICRFVENGVGVSVVPESAARRYRRTMAIQMLDLTDDWAVREMRVCVASRDGMATYAIQLLDHLVASSTAREIT